MKQLVPLIVMTAIMPALFGKSKVVNLKKWETYDMVISRGTPEPESPFNYDLKYHFTSPAGARFTLHGFYNGQNEWIIRFTPNEEGVWQAVGAVDETWPDLEKYEFRVVDKAASKHGSIILNKENPKKLYYEDGTPYNMLAFELDWLFALDYGNPDLPKTKQLTEIVKQHGFNKVIMNIYAFDRNNEIPDLKKEHDYGSLLSIFPFKGTNAAPDYRALNVNFFKHLDKVIELLNEHNIVAHLMIYVWNKQVNWPAPQSPADNLYFEYIIKRYQAYPNVIWDVSKEALAYGKDDMDYITERIERLRRLDQHKRLVTVHDYKYCSKYPEKVDIISIQDWSTDLYNNMLRISEKFAKPVFNIEHGGYEACQYDVFTGNYTNPEVCLRRNYLCAFAGIYSTYYWQCTSWNVIIHNPFDESIQPQPKFAYYQHFSDFLNRADFAQLTPVQGLSASGFTLFHKKKNQYYYFVPAENSAIDIKNLPESDVLEISWFHPYEGIYSRTEILEWSNYFRIKPAFPGIDSILIITLK